MNMKKTIAAIAAASVAVSAMATTISAADAQTFNYTLVNTVRTWNAGDCTITATIAHINEQTLDNEANPVLKFNFNTDLSTKIGSGIDLKSVTLVAKNDAGRVKDSYTMVKGDGNDQYSSWIEDNTTVNVKEIIRGSGDTDATWEITAIYGQTLYGSGDEIPNNPAVNRDIAINVLRKWLGETTVSVKEDDGDTVTNVKVINASASGRTEGFEKYPMMTTLSGTDVYRRLESIDVDGKGRHYTNVRAFVNDAIANYDSVSFTFHSATQKIFDGIWPWGSPAFDTTTMSDGTPIVGAGGVYNDWYSRSTDAYMTFDQHLYNRYYRPDGTGYTGFPWNGVNLFTAGLVINEGFTMSLADTAQFDYSQNAISFDLDTIMADSITANDYATFIHSLKLATADKWYWDSMDIVVEMDEAEDVSADAPAEADDETLDDDTGLDDEIIEDDEIEEPAENEEEEPVITPEPTPEPAPEATVSNPTTGNASVALAVIPVALAAAAVVAKKRS